MNYIATLPKELRDLLDYYVNYEHWKCLLDIFHDYSLIGKYRPGDYMRDSQITFWRTMIKVLPITFDSDIKNDNNNLHLLIKLPVGQLITKELLLKILYVLFSESTDSDRFTHRASINGWLRAHQYNERFAIIPIDVRNEIKIITV